MDVNRIICGDALEMLRGLPDGSVDAIITDPPYGLAGRIFDVPGKSYSAVNKDWDHFVPVEWLAECPRILKPGGSVVCFGGRQSIYKVAALCLELGWRLVNDVTWFKPDAVPNFTGRMMTESTERALWFCPDGTGWTYNLDYAKANNIMNYRDVWTFNTQRGNREHPTQKPVALMKRFVGLLTRSGELVLDPFAGSGTTLVAARRLGRRYLGSELSPEYVAIAERRLAEPYTPDMFEAVAAEEAKPAQLDLFAEAAR